MTDPIDELGPWGQMDSVVAIADRRGRLRGANRRVSADWVTELVSEEDRDTVRERLLACAFSTQPTRVRVTDLNRRPTWLELAPTATGEVMAVLLPAEPLSSRVTPPPAERATAPPPRARAASADPAFAVIVDPEHRDLAAILRRALDPVSSSVAVLFVPDIGTSGHASEATRLLIIGDSRFTRFLRKLAGTPLWSLEGVHWACEGRRAAVWYEEPDAAAACDLDALEAALDRLTREVLMPPPSQRAPPPQHQVAASFLGEFSPTPMDRRQARWPMRLAYIIGVTRFLVDGLPVLAGWGQRGYTAPRT